MRPIHLVIFAAAFGLIGGMFWPSAVQPIQPSDQVATFAEVARMVGPADASASDNSLLDQARRNGTLVGDPVMNEARRTLRHAAAKVQADGCVIRHRRAFSRAVAAYLAAKRNAAGSRSEVQVIGGRSIDASAYLNRQADGLVEEAFDQAVVESDDAPEEHRHKLQTVPLNPQSRYACDGELTGRG